MFTESAIAALESQFPTVPPARVRSVCSWVDGLSDVTNPSALVSSRLTKLSAELAQAKTTAKRSEVPAARGTFRDDGSWNTSATHASDAERQLVKLVATIRRMRLSPAQAAEVVLASPVRHMFREYTVARWALCAGQTRETTGEHSPEAWLAAAWFCCPTSTCAEQWLKDCLCGRKALPPLEPDTVAEHLADEWWSR